MHGRLRVARAGSRVICFEDLGLVMVDGAHAEGGKPYTVHPTPYTQHPTPNTLHPTPFTVHRTPNTLRTCGTCWEQGRLFRGAWVTGLPRSLKTTPPLLRTTTRT